MLDKLLQWSLRILVLLASVAMTAMIVVVVMDVAGRNLFDAPLTGAYELVEFCMGVLCPVSVVFCISRNEDICVDLVYVRLGLKAKKAVRLFANIFVTAVSVALMGQSWYLVRDILDMGVSTALLGVAMWPVAVLVLLSFVIMVPVQVRFLLRSFRTVDEEEDIG